MSWIEGIGGALIDVDGTLLSGDRAIPGTAEALGRLRERGIDYRLMTNTTRRSRSEQARALGAEGFEVEEREILMPAALARRRIMASDRADSFLLVPSAALPDFEGVPSNETDPAWVVLADLGPRFEWERFNRAFRCLMRGATLLALQKNPYWDPGDGPQLDAGAFVAGLEFATGIDAVLIGKPSRDFFELALEDLQLPAEAVLVIGDDPLNDARGGAGAGCRTALVRTGKFQGEADLGPDGFRPDLVLDSLADLMA